MGDYVRILSGNRAGQVLAVGRDISLMEAEIDVTTGVAEWCDTPVAPDTRSGRDVIAPPTARTSVAEQPETEAHDDDAERPAAPAERGDGGAADGAEQSDARADDGDGGAPAGDEGEAEAPQPVERLGGGWYRLSDGTTAQMSREEAARRGYTG